MLSVHWIIVVITGGNEWTSACGAKVCASMVLQHKNIRISLLGNGSNLNNII